MVVLATAYLLIGGTKVTYRTHNFAQGAIVAEWLYAVDAVDAVESFTIAQIGDTSIPLESIISPLLYGYGLQTLCQLVIKAPEHDVTEVAAISENERQRVHHNPCAS